MKILLIGRNGQVAFELRRSLAPLGNLIAVGHEQLDLEQPDSIRSQVREVRPDLIVNAAAYTSVDQAEEQESKAHKINAVAPGILAEEAERAGACFVHYSTDYVFDGGKPAPYTEDDSPSPINAYGRSKLAGERAIQAVGSRFLIFRTSWVYGPRGRNFLLTILRLAREREELQVVDDQTGAPTTSRVIADVTAQALGQLLGGFEAGNPRRDWPAGIYHLTCGGATTWFGFASRIVEWSPEPSSGRKPRLVPIATVDYPLPARRPPNSVLDGARLRATFGLTIPNWESALRLCLEEML